MDWTRPQALYFILPVSIGWLMLSLYSRSRRIRAGEAFVAQQMSNRILPNASPLGYLSKLCLQIVAILCGLVALAGPRYGDIYEQITPRGSDLYIMIDVSRSMLAEDVPPSRLARAKSDVASLVNRLEGERVGLIAFAGQAVVKCPLTVDYTSFRRSLDELDTNSAPRGGTAIGDSIRKALEVFQSNSDRDQSILLITDGDDQESYPLDAAALAAERKVTIFAIGLGDTNQGARIPQKDKSGVFMEHNGEQVWSKLDNSLLQEIALKTSGVYVPAGTSSYDLGELYFKYLQGKRGDEATSQTRVRKAERYQIFLAIAFLSLLIDLCIRSYRKPVRQNATASPRSRVAAMAFPCLFTPLMIGISCPETVIADSSTTEVRNGVRLYSEQKYEEAQQAFAAAVEKLEKEKSKSAAIAIFDEACALHRKGDFDKARDRYLQAGLSQDRSLATASHFNLGMMSSEKARNTAGDQPENATEEQRKEIIEQLKQSIASYRHCLELDPKHIPSRKNLELVRQWIKYYTDKWAEVDRQKRRNQTNLVQFLEFLLTSQAEIKRSVLQLPSGVSSDSWAELKRVQDELKDEIPELKAKIDGELRPDGKAGSQAISSSQSDENKEVEQAIQLFQTWADKAGNLMADASLSLSKSESKQAAQSQSSAEDELNRIWEAVVNFHPLLSREVKDQSSIAESLGPPLLAPMTASDVSSSEGAKKDTSKENKETNVESLSDKEDPQNRSIPSQNDPLTSSEDQQSLTVRNIDWSSLAKDQEKALARARLLAPKAESELAQLEQSAENQKGNASPNAATDPAITSIDPQQPPSQDSEEGPSQQVDPEKIKEGYRKAIELAPKAVDEMMRAAQAIAKQSQSQASTHAREAERILKEIQDAQPKNPQQNQNQNQDQQNKDQQNQDQQKNEQKDQDQDQKKDESSKNDDQPKDKEQQQDKKQQDQSGANSFSKDRMEEALRKVREREQEKHDRDRQLKARILGRTPVDKDW